MSQDKYSIQEFWDKSEWEGGLHELAGYGLEASAITDKQLAKLWAEYRDLYKKLEKKSDQVHDYLRKKGIEGP